jgi:hypothetical protein
MGVPVKKDELSVESSLLPASAIAGGQGGLDKSKKRKR